MNREGADAQAQVLFHFAAGVCVPPKDIGEHAERPRFGTGLASLGSASPGVNREGALGSCAVSAKRSY